MLPRFSTSCLRAATMKQAWHKPVVSSPLFRTLYTTKKPTLTNWTPIFTPKRIFTTTRPVFTQKAEKKIPTIGGSVVEGNKRNATDWAIIRQLMKYIWPKNDIGVKTRVVIALSLLVGGKVNIFIFQFVFVISSISLVIECSGTVLF